jgi:hypothetical protein
MGREDASHGCGLPALHQVSGHGLRLHQGPGSAGQAR